MTIKHGLIAAALIGIATGAFAHGDKRAATDDGYAYRSVPAEHGAIHFGANNPADQELAGRVASALAADPKLAEPGVTVTVSANNGRVMLSGSTDRIDQAARAEKIACDVAGRANVAGTLSSTAG